MRLVTVGHVTNDHLEGGLHPGGAALYAGLAAQAQGAKVTLVTRAGADFVGARLLETLHTACVLPAPRTTSFDERYEGTRRVARLRARASPVDGPIPPADVVLLCPVIDEVPPSALALRPTRLLAAGLQGWLRSFSPEGLASPRALLDAQPFAGCGLVCCSAEDLEGLGPQTLAALRATVTRVAVTHAEAGARVYEGSQGWHLPALGVDAVDPTGAGDVFLATLALQLARGASLLSAATWAVCAGAVAVTGVGPSALPHLSQLSTVVARYCRDAPPPRLLTSAE